MVLNIVDFCGCFGLFFSSRRRHTRLVSDWSSDVCSSDLLQRSQGKFLGGVIALGAEGMPTEYALDLSILDDILPPHTYPDIIAQLQVSALQPISAHGVLIGGSEGLSPDR